MYNAIQLAAKYTRYYFTAYNGRGHGVHSPFVFSFIESILRDKKRYDCYHKIENERKQLLADKRSIEVKDFGAGSAVIAGNSRRVCDIAASSLKPAKYAQLLFRIVQYFKPETILELGTSFGISTAYLASGNPSARVVSCEGAPAIAAIARQTFMNCGLQNISLCEGDFAETLLPVLQELKHVDLAFIDGNHRKAPTLDYFEKLLPYATARSIFIFDDIHWSAEMEEAWQQIQQNPAVTLSIDLFFIGIVIFSPDFNHKQQFSIRF